MKELSYRCKEIRDANERIEELEKERNHEQKLKDDALEQVKRLNSKVEDENRKETLKKAAVLKTMIPEDSNFQTI